MSEHNKMVDGVIGASAGDTKIIDAKSAFWFLTNQTKMSKELNLTFEQQREMMIKSLSVVKESVAKGF